MFKKEENVVTDRIPYLLEVKQILEELRSSVRSDEEYESGYDHMQKGAEMKQRVNDLLAKIRQELVAIRRTDSEEPSREVTKVEKPTTLQFSVDNAESKTTTVASTTEVTKRTAYIE